MALEKFFHIQFVVPKLKAKAFRDFLHQEGVLHLQNISSITQPYQASQEEEQQFRFEFNQAKDITNTFDKLFPKATPFIENFIPYKPQFTQQEIQTIDKSFSIPSLHEEISQLINEKEQLYQQIEIINSQILTLVPLASLSIPFEALVSLKTLHLIIMKANDKQSADFCTIPFIEKNTYIETIPNGDDVILILISKSVFRQEILDHMKRLNLEELDWKNFQGQPNTLLPSLQQKKAESDHRVNEILSELHRLSEQKDRLILKKDILQSKLNRIDESASFAESQYVVMVDGFLPASRQTQFENNLSSQYPDVYYQKTVAENPPIRFKNNNFFKPFEFIIRMFALPRSGMIDPTPVVAIAYLILFGLAFGDVIYGLLLVLACVYGIKKCKQDEGVVLFFKLFFYSGLSAMLFGALTNSWAGDLVSTVYLPENNFLVKLSNSVKMINSMEQVMTLLIAILYLGTFVQMLGVFCAMLQNIKDHQYRDAFFDQFTWLVFIPSAFLVAGEFLAPGYYPSVLIRISTYCIMVSLVLLFIGGTLKSTNPVSKIAKGFLNLYGIISSYGIASILSDVLSYLRLLALAVATSSMAMSFNLISSLMKDIPWLGPILVFILLVLTNMLNFLLSILGAFIHPVRLIFYEFFGRFFQDGGFDYKPYSMQYKHVLVNEEANR
jgi:V/A-type H+-transporting ATPase subunit I